MAAVEYFRRQLRGVAVASRQLAVEAKGILICNEFSPANTIEQQ
jgi:hypothetical protein